MDYLKEENVHRFAVRGDLLEREREKQVEKWRGIGREIKRQREETRERDGEGERKREREAFHKKQDTKSIPQGKIMNCRDQLGESKDCKI